MYGSPAMSKDLNLPFPDSPFKQGNEEADLRQAHQQQNMGSSGLLRYRTAPSNVLGDVCDDGVGAESMFARFMSPDLRDHLGGEKHSSRAPGAEGVAPSPSQTVGFPSSGPPHMFFHAPLYQQQQIPNLSSAGSGGVESGGNSNIVRHGSSSPGLFSHLNVENGFTGIRNMGGGFRSPGGSGGSSNAEAAGTTSSRLKGQISFNSRQGSVMSRISKIGSESLGGSSPEEGGCGGGGAGRCYIPGYPVASWEDTTLLSDSFSGGKRVRDPSDVQNGEMRSYGPSLTHHFSLPKTSTEVAAMERLLQFQDAVPCKIRAKRGCATHPRSIAERVRRTRISERMRKLQELVPNMEKQTNTADMLDLAVDYIKNLQREAKMLTESRAKCTCSSKQGDP